MPPGPEAPAGSDRLSGTIEGRPFTAAVAFAEHRINDDPPAIDIFVYERAATKEVGCDRLAKDWGNGERALWIQMTWPDRQGRAWDTHDVSKGAPGVFFTLSRVDRSSERVEGDVTIVDVRDDGGTLRLDVVSDNDRDTKIRGAVAGQIDFTICPDRG